MMYKRRRCPLLFALLLFAVASVGADTLAVFVWAETGPVEESQLAPLLAGIEEGAMETMFANGHIVFDIDLGEEADSTGIQAIDLARSGGATFLVLIEAGFELAPGRRAAPSVTTVTVVEVESERERPAVLVDPGAFRGSDEMSPDALAVTVGAQAAEHALLEIGEVEGAW